MAYFEEKELINKMQEGTNSSSYYDKYFTETSAGLDIEANNINVNCINSKNNKFSIDDEGNISCNTITTNNISSNPGGNIDFNQIYPVGSIYLSVNSLNPGTLFGGTWTQITDKFLIGASSSYPVNTSGGTTVHSHTTGNCTLNINQIPSHNHEIYRNVPYGIPYNDLNGVASGGNGIVKYNESYTPFSIGFTGGNQPHNHGGTSLASNIPPYLAVYIWQRIN